MPYPDYSNKPVSKLLVDKLTSKESGNSKNNRGEILSSSKHQILPPEKELKRNNSEDSSSPQPQLVQLPGESSQQTSSPQAAAITGLDISFGTIESDLPVPEIKVNHQLDQMSSDKKESRRSSDGTSGKKKKKDSTKRSKSVDKVAKEKGEFKRRATTEGLAVKENGEKTIKPKVMRDVSFEANNSEHNESSNSLQAVPKKSALKTSKFGNTTSVDTSDNPRPKISFGDTAVASDETNLDSLGNDRRKIMFQRAARGGSNANIAKPPVNEMQDPPEIPANLHSSNPAARRNSTNSDFSVNDLNPEHPVRRGVSMSNLVKRKELSKDSISIRNGSLKSRKPLLLGGANEEQLRRSAMSADDQIYVPPKSRYHSILQAWGHLMAGRVTELVLWTYGASFAKVMFFFLAFYVTNIFFWALMIMGADTLSANGVSCLYGDDANESFIARYELAFELSWCTFTTVGYGAINPPGDDWGCYSLRLVCAFIAFIGILFGSTTAAIMYSKLMRLLAQAQVTFSSTLCVQYGKGNEGSTVRFGQLNFRASVAVVKLNALDLLNDSDDEKGGSSDEGYPVIEFRMVNDRANRESSEIWDAQISGVVQLLKEEQPKAGHLAISQDSKAEGGESTLDLEKVVYYPVSLSPDSHPHFSRIWYARHVLNAESPLLKREFRDMIAQDGKWDKDFNTWQEIRDCLNPFISLRITLSGTSAVSAASVYAEHVYEFDDVCVGWRFANMVYEDSPKKLKSWWQRLWTHKEDNTKLQRPDLMTKVDTKLLHDIVPQPGDDHEPLSDGFENEGSMRKIKFW